MTIDEPGYFERLARVEARHWWSRSMWKMASLWLARAIRGRQSLEALDLGCGAGLSLIRLAGHREISRVVGLEPSEAALRLARRHTGFEVLRGSALDLPFDDQSFDVVTCFDVFQHLEEGSDRIAADELARVLRPGGVAVVRANSAGFGRGRSAGGSAYRLPELVSLLENGGMKIRKSSYANAIPALAQEFRGRFRFLAGSRGTSWLAHPSGGGLRLDLPSPGLNRMMEVISTTERRVSMFLHCPLPFGHSSMLLAEKPGGSR